MQAIFPSYFEIVQYLYKNNKNNIKMCFFTSVCYATTIDNIEASKQFKDCVIIEGVLDIEVGGGSQFKALFHMLKLKLL